MLISFGMTLLARDRLKGVVKIVIVSSMEGLCLLLLATVGLALCANAPYQVGVGRADVTGPSVQIEMVRARMRV